MRRAVLENRDTLPTFRGGNKTKPAPGIILEGSVAPSVESSRKMPSRFGPPGCWALSSLDARMGGEGSPRYCGMAIVRKWKESHSGEVAAEWTSVQLHFCSALESGVCSDMESISVLPFGFSLCSNP